MARTEDFQDGAARVREPQFKSVQQQHNGNFRAMSVLDVPGSIPNQNGLGREDLQRRIMGYQDTVSGRSQSTFDQELWLHNPESAPAVRRKMTNGSTE